MIKKSFFVPLQFWFRSQTRNLSIQWKGKVWLLKLASIEKQRKMLKESKQASLLYEDTSGRQKVCPIFTLYAVMGCQCTDDKFCWHWMQNNNSVQSKLALCIRIFWIDCGSRCSLNSIRKWFLSPLFEQARQLHSHLRQEQESIAYSINNRQFF